MLNANIAHLWSTLQEQQPLELTRKDRGTGAQSPHCAPVVMGASSRCPYGSFPWWLQMDAQHLWDRHPGVVLAEPLVGGPVQQVAVQDPAGAAHRFGADDHLQRIDVGRHRRDAREDGRRAAEARMERPAMLKKWGLAPAVLVQTLIFSVIGRCLSPFFPRPLLVIRVSHKKADSGKSSFRVLWPSVRHIGSCVIRALRLIQTMSQMSQCHNPRRLSSLLVSSSWDKFRFLLDTNHVTDVTMSQCGGTAKACRSLSDLAAYHQSPGATSPLERGRHPVRASQ